MKREHQLVICHFIWLLRIEITLTPFEQIFRTLFDVPYPFGFLARAARVYRKAFRTGFDNPAILQIKLIRQILHRQVFQRKDVLLGILFLVDQNCAIDQNVCEQKKLSGLALLSTDLRKHSLADQHTSGHTQRLEYGRRFAG